MNFCEICGREKKRQHYRYCIYKKEDIDNVRILYNNNESIIKIIARGFTKQLIDFALRGRRRCSKEANKLSRKNCPDSFKCSKKTREKISKARLLFLKMHPEVKPWQKESYPEKLFKQLIEKNELAKKYDIIKEYSFFPYFIDFAFTNIKLAVEIDGSQHWNVQDRADSDKKKDELLMLNGWKVYRVPAFLIKNDFQKVEQSFLQYLNTFDIQLKRFIFEQDIIDYKKIKQLNEQRRKRNVQQNYRNRLNLKQQLINKRCNDLKTVGKNYGYISKLSELWNVSHTQVTRFINKYCI